jgi:NO-binding membrane sensor protein with MHYT domain
LLAAPPQVPPAAPAVATDILVSVSVNVALVSAVVALLLAIEKVRVVTPPTPIVAGENALLIVGAATEMRFAESPAPVFPLPVTPATLLA